MAGPGTPEPASLEAVRQGNPGDGHPTTQLVENQPFLYADVRDIERNGKPVEAKYCVNQTNEAVYFTYVYIWTFSDTQWWGELLGYPDHDWDYEPVIVRVDKHSGQTTYIYDRGHYRAGITESRDFSVTAGTHYFKPANRMTGDRVFIGSFSELTDQQLLMMNRSIERLPDLPFGRNLSLDWACRQPDKVARKGSFSSDGESARVPARVDGLGGLVVGFVVLGAFMLLVLRASAFSGVSRIAIVATGALSGPTGGITGGMLGWAVGGNSESAILATAAGLIAGSTIGLGIGASFRAIHLNSGIRVAVLAGGLCGGISGLLTGIW
jgi:hypothetical protein